MNALMILKPTITVVVDVEKGPFLITHMFSMIPVKFPTKNFGEHTKSCPRAVPVIAMKKLLSMK